MNVLYFVLILLQVGIIVFFVSRARKQAAKRAKKQPDVYATFRNQAIHVTPLQLKLAIPNSEILIYGVVMDWDIGERMMTLAAYITGAASMYFNTGEGKTGGGKSPAVGEAAVDFVTKAQDYLDKATPVTTIEPPAKGMIRFYFLTNHKVYMVQEDTRRYEDNTAELHELFQLGNNVAIEMHSSGNES